MGKQRGVEASVGRGCICPFPKPKGEEVVRSRLVSLDHLRHHFLACMDLFRHWGRSHVRPVQVRIRQQLHSHVVRMGWFRRQMRWEVLQCPGLQEVVTCAWRTLALSDTPMVCVDWVDPTATAGSHQEEERACRLEDHTLNHPEAVVLEKVCRAGVDSRVDRNERHNEDHPVFGEGHSRRKVEPVQDALRLEVHMAAIAEREDVATA